MGYFEESGSLRPEQAGVATKKKAGAAAVYSNNTSSADTGSIMPCTVEGAGWIAAGLGGRC